MIEQTNRSPREDWNTKEHTAEGVDGSLPKLSQIAGPLLFLLIGVAWFSLDQLTGQMYQAHILPAYLIIGGLLILRASSN